MFKFAKLKALICAFVLLANSLSAADHKFFHHSHHCQEKGFTLADFAGTYNIITMSVGGVSGESGISRSTIGQVTFNKKGNGKINFISSVSYTGPIGSPLIIDPTFSAPDLVITLTLLDPIAGAGEINFSTASFGLSETAIFITNTQKGEIRTLDGHISSVLLNNQPAAAFLASFTLIKQK